MLRCYDGRGSESRETVVPEVMLSRICRRGVLGRGTRSFHGSSDEMRANDAAQSISGLKAHTGVLRNGYYANLSEYQRGHGCRHDSPRGYHAMLNILSRSGL